MNNVILFDLGDCILFRIKSHQEYDIALINKITKIQTTTIESVLLTLLEQFPGVYKFWLDNQFTNSLDAEDDYNLQFFKHVFHDLHASEYTNLFYEARKNESRYYLFEGVIDTLKILTQSNYLLGIASNGRPSRRRVLAQLKINKYFEDEYIFISDEMQCKKPNAEFFKYIINKHSHGRFTLCDDEDSNLEAAKEQGWNSIKIAPKSDNPAWQFSSLSKPHVLHK